MNSTNAGDRCKTKDILDAFCTSDRKMLYEFVSDWDNIDGVLVNEINGKKLGIVKVFSVQGNFGSKPVVELDKVKLDFLNELAKLMGKAAAVILKFRNEIKYWKIDRHLQSEQKMLRGKPYNFYNLPVNLLKNL